jgi:hypothetical protein
VRDNFAVWIPCLDGPVAVNLDPFVGSLGSGRLPGLGSRLGSRYSRGWRADGNRSPGGLSRSGGGLGHAGAGHAQEQNRQNGQPDSRAGKELNDRRLHTVSSARICERLVLPQLLTKRNEVRTDAWKLLNLLKRKKSKNWTRESAEFLTSCNRAQEKLGAFLVELSLISIG